MFTHLHVHSEYSLLDGACRLEQLMEAAKAMGQTAIAITDHGVMYGVVDFYKKAKKAGIKPIIGCEVYTARRSRLDKTHEHDGSNGHLVLLAKNQVGYQNLLKIVSDAYVNGFYNKPRTDFSVLEAHSEGLIALSACLAGDIPRKIMEENYVGAREIAEKYKSIFGKNFYIELQNHGLQEQLHVLPHLVKLAEELSIPLVATNDVHYLQKEDAEAQKVLMAVQMRKTVDDPDAMYFTTEEFYLKSEEEMAALFGAYKGAMENTEVIAAECHVEFTFGEYHLPHFDVPAGKTAEGFLRELAATGFATLYGQQEAAQKQLDYELDMIVQMGFVDYFLIVSDFIAFAKGQGIPVGPGRGSGAGSITAYCLGITGINPLQYDLLFERFLNPERVSMPDFDIDFCWERRGEVIDYVAHKYGSDHVAQIVTFGTMAAKAAIRDVGRALSIPYNEVDVVAKLVPNELGITLERAIQITPALREMMGADPNMEKLLTMAKKLEGMPRHASIHAAGIVITSEPVSNYVPLARSEEMSVTQFPMGTLEELGLLKMDFLGLRTLTLIEKASQMIRRRIPNFHIETCDYDDPEVYKMLASGETEGVFQLESGGMRKTLIGMKPNCFEDIIAAISLYRPGPMESIPKYIENKNHPESIRYKTPQLESILNVTYGVIVYQEQVMAIVRKLGGYSLGRADLVRRAMSKKKHDVMEIERKNFIHGIVDEEGKVAVAGCVRNGISEQAAADIFSEMASFASYAFNKSHAAAYAKIGVQTAILRKYYPKEFLAALLTTVLDSTDKVSEYIGVCQKLGITVLSPDVNESLAHFTVTEEAIRFGLVAIKNIGHGVIEELIAERNENGPFGSFAEFIDRMSGKDMNKKAVYSLICAGALDCFGLNRSQMVAVHELLMDAAINEGKKRMEGQISLFGGEEVEEEIASIPSIPEYDVREKLNLEKQATGFYLSGHPLSEYKEQIAKVQGIPIRNILRVGEEDCEYHDGHIVVVAAVITGKRLKTTRNDSTMCFLTLEDMTGSVHTLLFPKTLERYEKLLVNDTVVAMRGRISAKEDEDVSLICESIWDIHGAPVAAYKSAAFKKVPPSPPVKAPPPAPKIGFFIRVPSMQHPLYQQAEALAAAMPGDMPLCIRFVDTGQLLQHNSLKVGNVDKLKEEMAKILGKDHIAIRK